MQFCTKLVIFHQYLANIVHYLVEITVSQSRFNNCIDTDDKEALGVIFKLFVIRKIADRIVLTTINVTANILKIY